MSDRGDGPISANDITALLAALRAQISRAKSKQPFWSRHLDGIDPDSLTSRDSLAALPIIRKSDLVALQAEAPPYGGLNATAPGDLARLFISPGPIFEPEGHGRDWWGAARALEAAGTVKGDIVLNTFSYHLTPAGTMFESGAHALGCAVIPAGPGNTADQMAAIRQYRPTAYVGTPDFLNILLEKAEEADVDMTCFVRAVVSGAALPPSLREKFEAQGIATRQCYGTADLGIVAYEDDGEGLAVNDGVLLEIVRAGTGEPVADGEVGEIVVTRFNRDYPLIRFATGDLSKMLAPAPDGRPRIAGWMGRADQTAKVKGMFVRPEQLAAIGRALGIGGRMRLVVSRHNEQDVMVLKIEHDDPLIADRAAAQLSETVRLKGQVEIVPPGSLPNDGKVIADER